MEEVRTMKTYTLKEVTTNNLGLGCSTRQPLIGQISVTDTHVEQLVELAKEFGVALDGSYHIGEDGVYNTPATYLIGYTNDQHPQIWDLDPNADFSCIVDDEFVHITKSPVIAFCSRVYSDKNGFEDLGDLEDFSVYDGGIITFAPRPQDGPFPVIWEDEEEEGI